MKRNLLFVGEYEKCAEIYSKAFTVTLKDCNHMFSTESYKSQSCTKRMMTFLNSIIVDEPRLSHFDARHLPASE